MNANIPVFFISNINGQIIDTHRNIIENNTGGSVTEIIENICKIDSELYYIDKYKNVYCLHKIRFGECDNYIVDEFTRDFVRINDKIYNLIKKTEDFLPERVIITNESFSPNNIKNIARDLVPICITSLSCKYDNNNYMNVFVDSDLNLVVCKNNVYEIIKKNVYCNEILFIYKRSYSVFECPTLVIILCYDNKIVYTSYKHDMQKYILRNKIIERTKFKINKIWQASHAQHPFKISDSDNNIYNVHIQTPYRTLDYYIKIEKLLFNYSVANIICPSNQNWIYLSDSGFACDSGGKILIDKISQQTTSKYNHVKSANCISSTCT